MIILINQPSKAILQHCDTLGRMAKWTIKLRKFDISYWPRSAIKVQVLADFIKECTWPDKGVNQEKIKGQCLESM